MNWQEIYEPDMYMISFFAGEWREKFPTVAQPDLLKLDAFSSPNLSHFQVKQLHEAAQAKVLLLRAELEQAIFMEEFLSKVVTDVDQGHSIDTHSAGVTKIQVGNDCVATDQCRSGDHTQSGGQAVTKIKMGSDGSRNQKLNGSGNRSSGEQVGTELTSSWLDKVSGTNSSISSDEETDDTRDKPYTVESKNMSRNLITKVSPVKITDTADIVNTNNQGSSNLRTSSTGKDDSQYTNTEEEELHSARGRQSVSERVKSVEKRISYKKSSESLRRVSSDRPNVPPPPLPKPITRPRPSKPTPGMDADHLPLKSDGEPEKTASLLYRETPIDSLDVDVDKYVASYDQFSVKHPFNGEDADVTDSSVTHGRPDSTSLYRSGNKTETIATDRHGDTTQADTISHSQVNKAVLVDDQQGANSEDEDMKKIRKLSRGFSNKETSDHVLATSFRKISDDSSDDVVDVKSTGSYLDYVRHQNLDTDRDVVKELQSHDLSDSRVLPDKKKKSNYLHVSINVLLTQTERLEVSDETSSDSENDDVASRSLRDISEEKSKDGGSEFEKGQSLLDSNTLSVPQFIVHNKKISSTSIDTQSDEDDGKRMYQRSKSEDELDSISNDSHDELDAPDHEEEVETEKSRKLKMRKILVNGILGSEKTYLSCLDELIRFKRKLQMGFEKNPMCSIEDLTTIFYKVEDIHVHHKKFVTSLKEKVDQWSDEQEIGRIFKELIVFFPTYREFVDNTSKALECISKCSNENPDFKKMALNLRIEGPQSGEKVVTTIDDILFKPVQRLQRNTLVLHDLVKVTPEDHKDYATLQGALRIADHNLRNFGVDDDDNDKSEDQRHLVRSGFVVEMDGRSRKLRYLFLFSDVLVCTKHKISGRHKVRSFECKWFIPMSQISITSKDDKVYHCKEDIDAMKKKIVSLKAEMRLELRNAEPSKDRWSIAGRGQQRSIEKLRKKIEEQEASLVLASPHMPITMSSKGGNKYVLLLSNDFERGEWRDALDIQLKQHSAQPSLSHSGIQRQLSIHDIQSMINDSKQLPQVNKIGSVLMRKDDEMLNGNLNVTIHTLTGQDTPCEVFCQLELDSYGHFFMKARTTISSVTTVGDPSWDEDFELDLDGSQTLRILCYRKDGAMDVLIGRSALELCSSWLSCSFKEQKISMNDIALTISVRHTPTSKTLKRQPSKIQGGMFGVKLKSVTNREHKTVPTFVTTCLKEIEARGLDELGIYRVSGVTSEIQRLKKAFDKNMRAGTNLVSNSDIHAVTGVLKLFFRELPEPLFTEANYKAFVSTVGLKDLPSKEKCMLQVLHDLPDENYYTIVSVMEHLVKVAKCESENKMSISNLSTVFGPTLLQPAVKDLKLSPTQVMMQGAQDVFTQAEVLSFFLNQCMSGFSIRRSSAYLI